VILPEITYILMITRPKWPMNASIFLTIQCYRDGIEITISNGYSSIPVAATLKDTSPENYVFTTIDFGTFNL